MRTVLFKPVISDNDLLTIEVMVRRGTVRPHDVETLIGHVRNLQHLLENTAHDAVGLLRMQKHDTGVCAVCDFEGR